jgi:hypothetical protein
MRRARTIDASVRLQCSATPFWLGASGTVFSYVMPSVLQYEANFPLMSSGALSTWRKEIFLWQKVSVRVQNSMNVHRASSRVLIRYSDMYCEWQQMNRMK